VEREFVCARAETALLQCRSHLEKALREMTIAVDAVESAPTGIRESLAATAPRLSYPDLMSQILDSLVINGQILEGLLSAGVYSGFETRPRSAVRPAPLPDTGVEATYL
jgi:hypothetical protein